MVNYVPKKIIMYHESLSSRIYYMSNSPNLVNGLDAMCRICENLNWIAMTCNVYLVNFKPLMI